jgi:outer membrane protein OmpA-like peptidoglycan-associated protein
MVTAMWVTGIVARFCLCSLAMSAVLAQAPVRRPAKAAAASIAAQPKAITVTEDEPGCKDSTLLPRVPGCVIMQCGSKSEDSVELAVAATLEGEPRKVEVDGASETIYYLCNAKVTPLEVTTTLQAALTKDNYEVAFSGKDDEDSIVSARKLSQWIQVATYTYDGKPAYLQTVLATAPAEFVSADEFEDQFPASLRVSLPALKFATGKTELPRSAEKVLADIAALLAKKLDWKVRVDSYAADGADPASNLALSKARAAVIADWFSAHGVEKTRLESTGHGDTVPVDGKQRIELVKM